MIIRSLRSRMATGSLLDTLDSAHPGLRKYVCAFADYFHIPHDYLLERFGCGIEKLGEASASAACRAWEELGILPDIDIRQDRQVAGIWESPLIKVLLEDVLGFYPPDHIDVTQYVPPPCKSLEEFAARKFPGFPKASYWELSLFFTLPELYLDPFLPAPANSVLTGCDLACGWGRATFSLRNFNRRQIHCCDLSQESLDRLNLLAQRARLRSHLVLKKCNIFELPYEDESFDFFLAFDIFEHLTEAANAVVMREILRCARHNCILYTEIPLKDYCPAVTHIQDFTFQTARSLFQSCAAHGRGFKIAHYDPRMPNHFAFRIVRS
jgi:hypothetical protein